MFCSHLGVPLVAGRRGAENFTAIARLSSPFHPLGGECPSVARLRTSDLGATNPARLDQPIRRPRRSTSVLRIGHDTSGTRLELEDPMDTSTSYLGLKLPHPFVAGASPMGYHLDRVKRLED